MLQSIRDKTQGWIAGVIVSLLILSFALWGIHSYLMGASSSDVVAKVNGIEITTVQFKAAYERLRRQMQMQFGKNQLSEQVESNLKKYALEILIRTQVLSQASLKNDYRITSNQIDNFLEGVPEFQVDGKFSLARFQQALNATLFNASDFLELIKTTLLIDQSKFGVISTSFALPNEIDSTIALIGQERNIQYLLIPQNYFNNQPLNISDEMIKNYYAEHQEEFKTPEQVSVEYIMLSTHDVAAKIVPSEEQLKNFYNENVQLFAQPAMWQLEQVILPLSPDASVDTVKKAQTKMDELIKKASIEGKDITTFVNQYSLIKGDNKLTRWVSLNEIPTNLQKAVSPLTHLGQLSTAIRTEKGFVLLKVIGYKEPQTQAYVVMKDKVKEAYVHQKAEEAFADQREKLANLTYEHPDSLQTAAQQLGIPIHTTALFTKEKGGQDVVTANTKVREMAFGNDVLNLQNNSDIIPIDSESAIVLRVKSHVSAQVLSLSSAQNQIKGKLKIILSQDRLSKFANEMKNKLQLGQLSPNQISDEYHLQWNRVGFIGRHANKIDQAILDTAFEMPVPHKNTKMTYATTKVANGFAIIGLLELKSGNTQVSKEQYQAFVDQIQNSQGALEYKLYEDSLVKNAKIVIEN